MTSSSPIVARRRHIALAFLILALTPFAGHSITLRVGPSAGAPDSACDFATPQQAIDALPADGQAHLVEIEAGVYADADAPMDIDGLKVHVVASFAAGSGCAIADTVSRAHFSAPESPYAAGRIVVARNGARLTLSRINVVESRRGALLVRDSTLVLQSVDIGLNTTPTNVSGAGLLIEGGTVTIGDSTFSANDSGGAGGAIFCANSPVTPTSFITVNGESLFGSNTAIEGGAIQLFRRCSLSVLDSTRFSDNRATADGGAISSTLAPGSESSVIALEGEARFDANSAGRDGGAINVTGANRLTTPGSALVTFEGNGAGRHGGALHLLGNGPESIVRNGVFVGNSAANVGGAIAIGGIRMVLEADCSNLAQDADRYCARFERNTLASGSSGFRRGAAVYVGAGAELVIDRYAFRDSRGPAAAGAGDGGAVAWIDGGGFLQLSNALVFDTPDSPALEPRLIHLEGTSSATFLFNSIVDATRSTVLDVGPDARAFLAGNIISGNAVGIVGTGAIVGTCNNAQLGANAVPVDPGFVTTKAGRYRLGAGSAMVDRGATCDPDRMPDDLDPPAHDLVGRSRYTGTPTFSTFDLGALELDQADERIFGDGFEESRR